MLSDKELHELLNFKADAPVLSVYLNTEPEAGNADAYKLRLRTMLKEVDLPDDVSAMLRYFDHANTWSGRSIALFSCAPAGFFRAYPFAVPVRSRLRVSDHPHVKPLADLLDSYGGYGVALVDKQGARLFNFHLGELKESDGVLGETVRHTKRGGGSTFPGRRSGSAERTIKVDEVTDRNMRETVEIATHFFAENNVRRLLIGGTDENVSLFRSMLPKAWQSLVVGSFPVGMTANNTEVYDKAMQIGNEAELLREARLAEKVVTEKAKGHAAVLGLDDTLDAIREGRVQTLLIRDGYRAAGYVCAGCGYITIQELKTCPFCGAEFQKIPDAAEMAVRQVMQFGGDVEVIHQDQPFGQAENIGALLRF